MDPGGDLRRVRIHFETYWPEDQPVSRVTEAKTVRHLWFTAICTDEILCPDGGWYPYTPTEIRRKINDILLEKTDICLYTQSGMITGLYCDDHSIIDTIYQNAHTVEINLTTRSLKDIPIGPDGVNIWLPDGVINAFSVWGNAVWK